ncbi:TolB family protein [Kineosporia babensis]|uniref:WD40 repeat protein n=1 Tax=Kineosporia babensis TaxID=499548 RepID=A0A9X1NJ13_9ACTN|nr:hypothetical protein [Kineosporia babensis]MCD5315952.1 hypothetical protein [Kineosporia babensis]
MSFHRSTRVASAAVLGLALLSVPVTAYAAPSVAQQCPPTWLGTTNNVDPQISANGRYVVFTGYGPDGEIGDRTIFLRDRKTGTTTVASDPDQVRNNILPSISADGTRISYLSKDTEDFDNEAEIWVYDRTTGERTFEGPSFTQDPAVLDADGSTLSFVQLENGSTNRQLVYARDVDADVDQLVSATADGSAANGTSYGPDISADGKHVLFSSTADDLEAEAGGTGFYVRNLETGEVTAVPRRSADSPYQNRPQFSPDGRFVLYDDPAGAWRYDLRTGRTVSAQKRGPAHTASDISKAGRQVLLRDDAGLLVRTVATGAQHRVDTLPDGSPNPDGGAFNGAITPNGRYVTFMSGATGLDAGETAESNLNIYVRDTLTGRTDLVSTTDAGGTC